MNFDSMTNNAIAQEIGSRIEQLRLEQNMTQQALADEIGLSRVSYRKLAKGAAKFENIIGALRALGRMDLLEQFVPETTFSPMAQLKLKGKQPQRASGQRSEPKNDAEEVDW
jgi:putative transcriptional regulator